MAATVNAGVVHATLRLVDELSPTIAKAAEKVTRATEQITAQYTGLGKASQTLTGHQQRLSRLFEEFSGDKVIQNANEYATAIAKVGGAAKLTETEQAKVNAVVTEALAKYDAMGQRAPAALRELAEQTRKVEDRMTAAQRASGWLNDLSSQVVGSFAGFLSAQAVLGGVGAAFRGLTQFVGGSVTAYQDAEAASKKLTVALQNQGPFARAARDDYDKLADQFQRTTAIEGDLITSMQALLVQVGNVMPAQMEGALSAAADLSAGLGIDLEQAVMLVGKAFAGETGSLSRFGIVIDDAKLKTEGADAVLAAIGQRFGGQAQAELDTYAGKVKQLANMWGDVQEVVGEKIATDPVVNAALELISRALTTQRTEADGTAQSWGALAAGMPTVVHAYAQLRPAAELMVTLAEASRMAANVKPPAWATSGAAGQFSPGSIDIKKYLDDEAEAQKKAAAAAEQHAAAIAALREQLSGRGTIKAATDLLDALRGTVPVAKMTREAQESINKTMGAALDVYRAQGRIAPEAIRQIYAETLHLDAIAPRVVTGLSNDFRHLGTEVQLSTPAIVAFQRAIAGIPPVAAGLGNIRLPEIKIEIPKPPKLSDVEKVFEGIKGAAKQAGRDAIAALEQGIASGDWKGMLGQFGAIGTDLAKSITGGLLSMIPGIGPLLSEFAGPLVEGAKKLFKNIFGMNSEGRDAVKEFANGFGGFDALHRKLGELGAKGEQLWIQLTQKVGRGNVEQAQSAIAAIESALSAHTSVADRAAAAGFQTQAQLRQAAADAVSLWEQMRDSGEFSATAVESAWQKAQEALRAAGTESTAALQTAADAASANLARLDQEIASLQAAIANEAPEEVMGVVEAQARARLAALQAERDAAAQHVEDVQDQLRAAMEEVAAALRDLPKDLTFNVTTHFQNGGAPGVEAPEPDDPPGFATGTGGRFVDFGAGTHVMLHGRERVVTEAEGQREREAAAVTTTGGVDAALLREIARGLRRLPEMNAIALRDALAQARV